ncbi:helix-turn-helix domain containing protein [Spongiactinospora sp. TRM90649]|uniref:TetR/AcrR family transcriptional regulator n=1 Tax=Spongiactinospora sp. TRM90649 TaxID=3031114 RepID=UPI0023F94C72|nr:helix-turn-helix domain containing protein [Spongiactinospora sp. TRM90649]MDF5757130.1 helix-turn-helix domain containing protein [Spongiactinospora sp. TRM90649]
MRDSADTRTRIQHVALTLFNEKGYEATSLREIAEKLGVTKAALYYHFKSKDEIVSSLAESRLTRLSELLDWARTQPLTAETRQEIIRRYSDHLHDTRHADITRFFERNQTAMRDHPTMHTHREAMLEVVALLYAADDTPATRLKRSLALFALHAALMLPLGDLDDEERRAAALEVAMDLLSD